MDRDELIARYVFEAMRWAAKEAGDAPTPDWIEGGNSHAQDEARRAATRIAALQSRPAPTEERAREVLAEELRTQGFDAIAADVLAASNETYAVPKNVALRAMLRFSTETQGSDAEAETYRQMHEIAAGLGYPSILEALEAAPHATDTTPSRAPTEQEMRDVLASYIGSPPGDNGYATQMREGRLCTTSTYNAMRAIRHFAAPSRNEEGSVDREAIATLCERIGDAFPALTRRGNHDQVYTALACAEAIRGNLDGFDSAVRQMGHDAEEDWVHFAKVRDAILALTTSTPETPGDCTCVVAFGQDEGCPSHGIGTAWRADNPQADLRANPAAIATPERSMVLEEAARLVLVESNILDPGEHPALQNAIQKLSDACSGQ
jgi:hypothetical protein